MLRTTVVAPLASVRKYCVLQQRQIMLHQNVVHDNVLCENVPHDKQGRVTAINICWFMVEQSYIKPALHWLCHLSTMCRHSTGGHVLSSTCAHTQVPHQSEQIKIPSAQQPTQPLDCHSCESTLCRRPLMLLLACMLLGSKVHVPMLGVVEQAHANGSAI